MGGALVLGGTGGGTLAFTRTGTNTQTFTSTTVNSGENAVTESLATQTIGLGTITHATGGTLGREQRGYGDHKQHNQHQRHPGRLRHVRRKTTWAVAPATSGGAITGLSTYTTSVTAGTAPANFLNQNIDVTAATTPTGAITPNSLRFNTATAFTLTLPAGSVNTIVSGGILDTPTGSGGGTITGGFLTAGGGQLSVSSGGANGVNIGSLIIDNGTTPLAVVYSQSNVQKGSGFSNANNSYSGGTYLNGGSAGFTSGGTPFGTGNLNFGDQFDSGAAGGGLPFGGNTSFTSGLLAMPLGNNAVNGDIGGNKTVILLTSL